MPLSYKVDSERRLVIASATGTLTIDDIFAYQHEAWSGSQLRGYNELVDMTSVELINPPQSEQLRAFSEFAASMDAAIGESKLAIIAKGDLDFGLARMFQAFREMNPNSRKIVSVFRSMNDALAFLGINDPGDLSKTA